jgi:hypothetical protein
MSGDDKVQRHCAWSGAGFCVSRFMAMGWPMTPQAAVPGTRGGRLNDGSTQPIRRQSLPPLGGFEAIKAHVK